ncbi:lipase family alpha/beta hydrolase [Micromonospora inyonensis]|uniref:Lipase (Class 2) n=1 Tax=Micromonospora inyonensis TaxID=47866 RepID=A0A1C6S3C0_9ACTN|nr:alpha/beta fold hydrolase [Micromonospora inyonensis]SCL23823.1 Lipase (class 2) [Micromonospora inyonensis]
MLLRKILVTATAAAAILVPATAATAAPTPVPADAATGTTATSDVGASATNPVIVVGGLSGVAIAYEPLAARLRGDGHRVSIYQLPGLGLGDIAASARSFSGYVAQVRANTGAAKVDLVAHSEGGLVSRYYLKYLGGTGSVGRLSTLGSPHYGTYIADIATFLGLGDCIGIVACQQMAIGSAFLNDLNAGDDTPGTVRYTTIRTLQDELVRPTQNATLADGAVNALVQTWCPVRIVGHLGLVLDGTTYTMVQDALADRAITPNCFAV